MKRVPVSGMDAVYCGKRYRIAFGDEASVALFIDPDADVPDACQRGVMEHRGLSQHRTWAKVPVGAIDGKVAIRVTGILSGHKVTIQRQLPDGPVRVEFIGSPTVATELGMEGDQHMGWTGLFDPEDFEDIHVEETRIE